MSSDEIANQARQLLDLELIPPASGTVREFLAARITSWLETTSPESRLPLWQAMVSAGLAGGKGGFKEGDAFAIDSKTADAVIAEAIRQMSQRPRAQGIRDVRGNCPACGRPNLHLMQTGNLQCLTDFCPDPLAAHKLLAHEHEHIVYFYADGWHLIHPSREIVVQLAQPRFECTAAKFLNMLPGPPGGMFGKYRLHLEDGRAGVELLEGIESGN
jgi:hypothetical protein